MQGTSELWRSQSFLVLDDFFPVILLSVSQLLYCILTDVDIVDILSL